MKLIRSGLALAMAAVAGLCIANAGTCDNHPQDSTADPIGSFSLSTVLHTNDAESSTEECTVIINVCVFRTEAGRVDYFADLSTTSFQGDGGVVNSVTTLQMVARIARAAVARGLALGYGSCPSICSPAAINYVYVPSCVQRSGSGTSTSFSACTSSFSNRQYLVCCPNGTDSPQISDASPTGTSCSGSGGCEATCP